MTLPITSIPSRPSVAFGPVVPGWGSWEWLGAGLATELAGSCATTCFPSWDVPDAAVVFVIKHVPPPEWLAMAAERSAVVFCPVDAYGSPAAIDADAALLRQCGRIVVSCERLRRFFAPYAPVEYLDHPVKFAAPLRPTWQADGPFLWVGVRSNLPPLIEWVNRHPLPGELVVLTNLEDPADVPAATAFGFRPDRAVRIEHWSPERHLERTAQARAALDVKGQDFRARHKPPAKALDFLASGVPLALNPDSSPVEHLARLGFTVASPLDTDRWLSRDYWEDTQRFGAALRELLSLRRVGLRYRRLIDELVAERGKASGKGTPGS
jgi:hypothetical protein